MIFSISRLDPVKITGLTLNDVVLDIGCGDGRVLVTAAKMLGCRGIGIDVSEVKDYAMPRRVCFRFLLLAQILLDIAVYQEPGSPALYLSTQSLPSPFPLLLYLTVIFNLYTSL